MSKPCLEIVVYNVTSAQDATAARRAIMPVVKTFPGFISWRAYRQADGNPVFADCVEWASLAEAQAASEAFAKDPRMAPFMQTISGLIAMSHLELEAQEETQKAA